jgi:hypothetical protein
VKIHANAEKLFGPQYGRTQLGGIEPHSTIGSLQRSPGCTQAIVSQREQLHDVVAFRTEVCRQIEEFIALDEPHPRRSVDFIRGKPHATILADTAFSKDGTSSFIERPLVYRG